MRSIKITYWVLTGLFALLMLMSCMADLTHLPDAVTIMSHLGYPLYLMPFFGVAKLLGIIAIIIPRFSRIKEWAYAGFVFDLTGAIYSHLTMHDLISKWPHAIVLLLLLSGSYIFYHKLKQQRQEYKLNAMQVS